MTGWHGAAKWWLWTTILWCCGPGSASGQTIGSVPEDAVELGSVVVTATKTEVPVKQVAASVTVITKEEIEARQVTQVTDLLRDVPGLSVTQTGSRGGTVSVFPRGGESRFNLVLIDGIKVNDAGGSFDFSDLSTDNIERIEIVRGPHSALYGSDAMGSVIQIFTKRGKGVPQVEVSFAGGNLSTFEEKLNLIGGSGRAGYSLSVGRTDTEGSLRINNDFRETTVSGRLDYAIEKALDLNLIVRFVDSAFEFPTGDAGNLYSPLDPRQSSDRTRLLVSGKASHALTPWWQHTMQVGFYRHQSAFDDPFDPVDPRTGQLIDFSAFHSTNEERRVSADYFWNLTAPTVFDVSSLFTVGFAFEREEFQQRGAATETDFPFSSRNEADRDNKAGYLQGQLDWRKQLFLTAGFRVDGHSTFGTEVTPRVSGAYILPFFGTKLRAGYGEGIKAPTFIQNFGDGSSFVIGNPDLKPERSRGWEVGFDQSLLKGLVELNATYFHNRFTNLIAFVGGAPSFRNVQSARAKGIEAAARVHPGFGLTVGGTYTFLESKVLDNGGVGGTELPVGAPLIRRPKHRGSLSIDHVWERLHTNLTATFVGAQEDLDFRTFPSPRVTLPSYTTVDVAFAYLLLKDRLHLREVSLFGKVQNLFDEGFQETFGFSAPRITFLLGFKGSL
ncbi:MAG: TonB-dependent receptor [Candidatus Methylomirabilis oxygeniifera]|uniref:Putative TonB-dependent outer membrane receptor for cobalamin and Fe transport n=1 Tax=Methylomirabilis oxygeniifera TaxID=671143 RepID=D5MHA1_METO1|nr:MAG: TonB-dependent receptor [Candidatus Methylomirabilis oxyfera]CBE69133.1 putative TonB-dependent outer membrane receptor for cobalamin and Fe transport [Candidatus Methylomirabilis oxyfera]